MKIIEQTEAVAPLAAYAADIAQEPVIVTVNGKPVAALVAIENADLETVSLSTNFAFLALIERSRAPSRRGRTFGRRDAAPSRIEQAVRTSNSPPLQRLLRSVWSRVLDPAADRLVAVVHHEMVQDD